VREGRDDQHRSADSDSLSSPITVRSIIVVGPAIAKTPWSEISSFFEDFMQAIIPHRHVEPTNMPSDSGPAFTATPSAVPECGPLPSGSMLRLIPFQDRIPKFH
jgi:hypothetical protein